MQVHPDATRRYGRLPSRWCDERKRMARLFNAATLPTPKPYDLITPFRNPSPLGNDQYGDCGVAALGHEVESDSLAAGKPLTTSTKEIVNFYFAVTGGADNGTNMGDDITHMAAVGIAGSKPLAYIPVDLANATQAATLGYAFGGLYCGFNLPLACERTVDWSMTSGQIAGGHAVYFGGWDGHGFIGDSWGQKVVASPAFFAKFGDEAYALLLDCWFDATGRSPVGLTWADYAAIIPANGGTILPGAKPPVPSPSPSPTPTPSPSPSSDIFGKGVSVPVSAPGTIVFGIEATAPDGTVVKGYGSSAMTFPAAGSYMLKLSYSRRGAI